MGADVQDLIAKLQIQLGQQQQQNNPSLFGLQAAPDPNSTAAILKKLQDQQYVDEQGNQGGEYGFLANAGRKDFARAGQSLGNLLGVGQPQQMDNSNVMAQRQAIAQGKTDLAQGLSQPGADPNQVQLQVLSKLAQQGVPGAAEALEKANDNAQKLAQSRAAVFKDTGQGTAAFDEIQNRAQQRAQAGKQFDQSTQKDTWSTIGQGNGYAVQKNGLGEMRSIKISDAASTAAAGIDPAALQRMVDEKLTTGKDPTGLSKAGLLVPYQNALAARLEQTGDTQGAANARAVGLKSAAKADQLLGTQLANTQTAGMQIEKNITSLQAVADKLGGPGSPLLQKAVNQFNQGLKGDKDTAQAVFYINELQNELAKLSSNSFGNTPLSDSAKADAKDLINKSMIGTGSLDGVFMASRKSYLNKLDSLNESRATNKSYLTTNAPGSPFAAPAAAPKASAPQQSATPMSLDDYLKSQGH